MEKTSLILFGKEYEAFQKLDYFLCGIAGALFAYIGQTYTPQKLDIWYHWLMPSALLSLTACFLFGLKTLQAAVNTIAFNRKAHFAAEQSSYYYDELAEHVKDPKRRTFDKHTRTEKSIAELESLKKKFETEHFEAESKWRAEEKSANRFSKLRTVFLILGFMLILASKVLQPYFAE